MPCSQHSCYSLKNSCLTLLLCLCAAIHASEYHSIVEKVVYKYPGNVRGDTELAECGPMSVCSVVRLRYWQSPVIHRMCNCMTGGECPWQWSDARSMPLDNRSQLKFCERVDELPICPSLQTGLIVLKQKNEETDSTEMKTQALCQCRWPAYWQLHRHYYRNYHNGTIVTNDYYRCAKLEKCEMQQFCGHVVAETHSVYYRCSCPAGTLCLTRDRTRRNVTELFYSSLAYRAYCLPLHSDP